MSYGVQDKHIVLGVSGGIAAYKSAELLRLIMKNNATAQVVMTANAARFVAPLTFEALSRRKVCVDLFRDRHSAAVDHIQWAEEADAVVIAPATANVIAKMAHGIADDALTTLMLAVTCPVLICPAMNTHMYESRPVQRNLDILRSMGFEVLAAAQGELACGTTGPGRLPDPALIADRLDKLLIPKDFKGRKVLVTAGPTREAIDPVRFISNPSSGKMGYALAAAAEMRGADVVLISGPTDLAVPYNVHCIQVATAAQMAEAVFQTMSDMDLVIKSAAVSDFRPKTVSDLKVKKEQAQSILELERTEDILKGAAKQKTKQVMVGFAAETHQLYQFAAEKLKTKNLDLLVANQIGGDRSGFAADTNQVILFHKDGTNESLDLMPKSILAHVILDRVANVMAL
jgi:phosphopantothenoylcysteine decarboxylase/phosphopantothenate--cysteine ligase